MSACKGHGFARIVLLEMPFRSNLLQQPQYTCKREDFVTKTCIQNAKAKDKGSGYKPNLEIFRVLCAILPIFALFTILKTGILFLSFSPYFQHMRFKSKLLLCTFTALAGIASACEPECRHSIAEAFAERYIPVVQRSVSDLNDLLYENLYNVPIPEKLLEFVPEDVLRQGVRDNLENGLETFVDQLNVTDGIYLTLFSGDEPFKGDCNDPPRLTRKKPPVGESWTLEECTCVPF